MTVTTITRTTTTYTLDGNNDYKDDDDIHMVVTTITRTTTTYTLDGNTDYTGGEIEYSGENNKQRQNDKGNIGGNNCNCEGRIVLTTIISKISRTTKQQLR